MRLLPALLLVAAAAVLAEAGEKVVVTTKTGRTVVGEIVARDESRIRVATEFGEVELRVDQVASMVRADGKDPAGRSEAPPKGAKDTPPAAKPSRTPEQLEALRARILEGFASEVTKARATAADELVAAWPDSAPILDEALASKTLQVRLDGLWLLDRDELGDTQDRLEPMIGDPDATVRTIAIRIARHRRYARLEPKVLKIASDDPAWPVRREALRTLETIGTKACLPTALAGFERETDAERKRYYKRLLVKLVGADHGDDVEAWRLAVDAARTAK